LGTRVPNPIEIESLLARIKDGASDSASRSSNFGATVSIIAKESVAKRGTGTSTFRADSFINEDNSLRDEPSRVTLPPMRISMSELRSYDIPDSTISTRTICVSQPRSYNVPNLNLSPDITLWPSSASQGANSSQVTQSLRGTATPPGAIYRSPQIEIPPLVLPSHQRISGTLVDDSPADINPLAPKIPLSSGPSQGPQSTEELLSRTTIQHLDPPVSPLSTRTDHLERENVSASRITFRWPWRRVGNPLQRNSFSDHSSLSSDVRSGTHYPEPPPRASGVWNWLVVLPKRYPNTPFTDITLFFEYIGVLLGVAGWGYLIYYIVTRHIPVVGKVFGVGASNTAMLLYYVLFRLFCARILKRRLRGMDIFRRILRMNQDSRSRRNGGFEMPDVVSNRNGVTVALDDWDEPF
jgi:hypothetical protein